INFQSSSLSLDWIVETIQSRATTDDVCWAVLFPFILWQIWCSRNNLVFSQKRFDWKALTAAAYNAADEYIKVLAIASKFVNKSPCHIQRTPPNNCFVKLNVDGASGDTDKAGVGGVLRAADGKFLAAFAKHI
ncbi:hypothetical protein MKX01_035263, partial [Papaver californicum]